MKSEELQKLTASEPLTLDEEYNMQESWREDEDSMYLLCITKFPNKFRAQLFKTKDIDS